MKKIIILATLCCFALVSCNKREIVYNESDLITEYALPLWNIQLSPSDSVCFLIDTGSDFSIINESFYNYKSELFKIGGTRDTEIATIGGNVNYSLQIVNPKLDNGLKIPMYVMEINSMTQYLSRKSGMNVVGVIGSDFFTKYKVTLDFENNKIITMQYVKKSK